MFDKAKTWHTGLSKAGKVTLWAVTAVVGGSAINAAANPGPATPPKADPPAVVQQETPKKPVVATKTITETTPVAYAKTQLTTIILPKEKMKSELLV